MTFEDIQPDTMATQVTKYAKMVYQFEKGLPPNEVVPALKFKVEDMKDKVSYITHTVPVADTGFEKGGVMDG